MTIARVIGIRPTGLAGCLGIALGAALVCLSSPPAWAGAPSEQLRVSVDQVVKILEDPTLKEESRAAERRAAIRREAEALFDFGETARRALGPHWQDLSGDEQREFASLFADLVERSYIARIEQFSGERITYAGESVEGDSATVKTRFTTKQGTDVPIDYRLLRRGDRWAVYDVSVEGVSLISNYRTQFDRIMRTGSYQELARRLRANQTGRSAPDAPPSGRRAPRS
jgi:phospholipid transport system substrate-binding protein